MADENVSTEGMEPPPRTHWVALRNGDTRHLAWDWEDARNWPLCGKVSSDNADDWVVVDRHLAACHDCLSKFGMA